jgi:2-keto-4-pentenoate hydratase
MDGSKQQDRAAHWLAAARRSGWPGARIPEDCRPATIDAALWIQLRVAAILGEEVGGWKCALPAPGRPVTAAPIFSSTIWRELSAPLGVVPEGDTVRIEPEIAFMLGRDLPPRDRPYADDEVAAAVAQTHLALEVLGCRYADRVAPNWAEMLADGLQNQGLVLGSTVPGGPKAALEAFPVTIVAAGGSATTHAGRHGDGHPLRPLCWLANFLTARGTGLVAGEAVTTGSYAGAIAVPLGVPLRVVFGDLGAIAVELAARPRSPGA